MSKFKDFQNNIRGRIKERKKQKLYKIIVDYAILFQPSSFLNIGLLIVPYFSDELLKEVFTQDLSYEIVSCKKFYNSIFSVILHRPSHVVILNEKN